MATKFGMRVDPWWRPLLLVGGSTPANSYAELNEVGLTISLGFLFNRTIARSDIESAEQISWPFWMGVGWRTNFRNQLGLIGSYQGVVEMKLKTPIRVLGLLNCDRVAISLEEPEAFLAALNA
ncbi:MAG: hypothetical protein WD939_09450 [Dehalococcoidia bacterium]